MVRIVEQTGRVLPPATPVQTATGRFGQMVERPTLLGSAPVDAFGDLEGQKAVANALADAGNTFFNIGAREARLQQAEEDTKLERMLTDINYEEAQIRQALEEEQSTTYRNADQKHEEYLKRLEGAEARIRGDYQFRTYTSEAVNTKFGDVRRTREIEYRAGQLERDRRDGIIKDSTDTLLKYTNQAALAGKNNAPEQFAASIESIEAVTTSAKFIAAIGGVAKAAEVERQMIQQSVMGFVQETAERNPQDALTLVNAADSVLARVMDAEDLNLIREDLTDIVKREQIEKDQEFEKEQEATYGDLMLGIRDVRSSTGRPTTRFEIKQSKLTDLRKAQLLNAYDAEQNQRREAANKVSEVNFTLQNGGSLIADPNAQSKVDQWFISRWNAMKDVPDPVRQQQIMKEVTQLGVLPTAYRNIVEGLLYNENESVAAQAAATINQVKDLNPNLVFSDNAEYFARLVGAGIPAAEAKKRINDVQKITPQEREMMLKQLDTKVDAIADLMDDADVETDNPIAIAQFTEMYQQNYLRLKSKEAAFKQAESDFKRTWGRTEVGGIKKVIQYPPEKMYGPIVAEEYEDFISANGRDPDDYTIIYNESSKKNNPSYFVIGVDGMPLFDEKAVPVLWTPSVKNAQKIIQRQRDEELQRIIDAGVKVMEEDVGAMNGRRTELTNTDLQSTD